MAHVWIDSAAPLDADQAPAWSLLPIDRDEVVLAGGAALLRRCDEEGAERWVLLGSGMRINGVPRPTGVHVLRDRDHLSLAAAGAGAALVAFFSDERLARVEPLPPAERALFCPRCKLPIDVGSPAVRCPQCGVWQHQSDEYPCFVYADCCPSCTHAADLSSTWRWSPAEL